MCLIHFSPSLVTVQLALFMIGMLILVTAVCINIATLNFFPILCEVYEE